MYVIQVILMIPDDVNILMLLDPKRWQTTLGDRPGCEFWQTFIWNVRKCPINKQEHKQNQQPYKYLHIKSKQDMKRKVVKKKKRKKVITIESRKVFKQQTDIYILYIFRVKQTGIAIPVALTAYCNYKHRRL